MSGRPVRLNVTLEAEYAAKLSRLASRVHVQEGTLARALLSTAIDEVDPDASIVTDALDAIPGGWERAQRGLRQARRGETRTIGEL